MSDGREGGYIKLYRQIGSWPLWKSMTSAQRMVWVELLLCANWRDDFLWYGSNRIPVLRGQLAHSEAEIARRAKVGRKVVRQTIEKLQVEGAIGREKAPLEGQAPHLITIINYERFQSPDDGQGQPEGQARAKRGPSEGQARALREEGEEGKKEKILPGPPTAGGGEEGAHQATLIPIPSQPERRKAPGPTDPRFAPLKAAWLEEYAAAYPGAEYRWSVADSQGVHRIIGVAPDEVRKRARRSFAARGFLHCGSLAKLTSNDVWNQLAADPSIATAGPRRVIANVSTHREGDAW